MNSLGYHCNHLHHLREGILGNDLSRGEFYNFPPGELQGLRRAILSHNLRVSIHCPLVRLDWYPTPPTQSFLCDVDKENRNLTLRMIAETMEQAADFGAEYVVAHFPTPPTDASGESSAKLEGIALGSCERLAELSVRHGIPIHLEGVGAGPFLNGEFLGQILSEFSSLRYCFDTGHMHLASQNAGFDLYLFAEQLAPYLGSIHLWNVRGADDYLAFHHIPVHPTQKPEEGWVDIPRLLPLLISDRPATPIIFESAHLYPRALGNYDYRDGVKWVKGLVATLS